LGDVVDVDNDLHGDGVNIAARLQAMAEPGGGVVSGAIYDVVKDRVPAGFRFLGQHRLKNIAGPVRVYRIIDQGNDDDIDEPVAELSEAYGGKFARPSIAVRPFRPKRRHRICREICDRLTEELVLMLVQISNIDVVHGDRGPNSDLSTLGHAYELIGTGEVADGRFNLGVRLVKSTTGQVVWGDRLDCDVGEAYRVQDRLARELITALQVTLTEGEQARFWNRGTTDSRAWELYQRGRHSERASSRTGQRECMRLFRGAICLDPRFGPAAVALGYIHMDELRRGFAADPRRSQDAMLTLHRRAGHLDPQFPEWHGLGAYMALLDRNYDHAIAQMLAALRISPNNPELYGQLGMLYVYAGRVDEGISHYRHAVELTPHAPIWIMNNLGWAFRRTWQLDEAFETFEHVLRRDKSFLRSIVGMISTCFALGHIARAKRLARDLQRLDPEFKVESLRQSDPTADRRFVEELAADLRAAGVP
jgi:adenylate cyclase